MFPPDMEMQLARQREAELRSSYPRLAPHPWRRHPQNPPIRAARRALGRLLVRAGTRLAPELSARPAT